MATIELCNWCLHDSQCTVRDSKRRDKAVHVVTWPRPSGSRASIQCNGVYKNLLTKILSGYFFAETRTSGGYPTLVYSILLNIATKLELRKATHAAKLELLEATLVALESYKRRRTVHTLPNRAKMFRHIRVPLPKSA